MSTRLSVSEDCEDKIHKLKLGKTYRYITCKLDDTNTVVVEKTGALDASFSDFLAEIPDDEGRFLIYDYVGKNASDGKTRPIKVLFLNYSPDTLNVMICQTERRPSFHLLPMETLVVSLIFCG